ncbi:MAG: methylmalonyl Co-A mutase-associated GTPase MeaB [Deinococcus sp.]|nr:methylmalonyl Co-A mutase-associated GTPase MeaB [Deinococcus sp.]
MKPLDLARQAAQGDRRALAQLLSWVEDDCPEGRAALSALVEPAQPACVIGITGSPGCGKSTLVDALIAHLRQQDLSVAVLAVDPSSPFSGGAILGDRIRMSRHFLDPGVFIRSLASRGSLGGLAPGVPAALRLFGAVGFPWVLIETVGVGQSEIDVAEIADLCALVLSPATGDGIQAFKAGILEVADVVVINKADLDGALELEREVKATLALSSEPPPVLRTVALSGEGVDQLYAVLSQLWTTLRDTGGLQQRRRRRTRYEVAAALRQLASQALAGAEAVFEAVEDGRLSAQAAAERLLAQRHQQG